MVCPKLSMSTAEQVVRQRIYSRADVWATEKARRCFVGLLVFGDTYDYIVAGGVAYTTGDAHV